jgi:hypothetical protein
VVRIWNIADGALRVALGASSVTAAAYTRAGTVVTAGDGGVRFWTPDGAELGAVALGYPADHLIMDPGGRWRIVGGTASSLLVIDLAARTVVTHLAIRDDRALAVAADATRVAVSDGRSIRLWQLGSRTRSSLGDRPVPAPTGSRAQAPRGPAGPFRPGSRR